MPQSKLFDKEPPKFTPEEKAVATHVMGIRTPSRDARFPSTNQAGHCWNRYNEWLLCLKQTKDEPGCVALRYNAESICPSLWVEKWDEEREENTFAGLQVNDAKPAAH